MTDNQPQHEDLPALGDDEAVPADDDFAGEHDSTAVDPGDDGEQESPQGRSGMESGGPP